MSPLKKKMVLVPLVRAGQTVKRPRPRLRKRVFYTIFGPLLTVIGFVVVTIFKLFSGPLNRASQKRFAEDLRTYAPFLFHERDARIIPNEGVSRELEGGCVTVAADHLRFQFYSGMGDFSVRVGSDFAPQRYEGLELVIAATGQTISQAERPDFYDLRKIDGVLRKWFDPLKEALAAGRAEATLNEAIRINNDRVDRYVAELQAEGFTPKVFER